MSQRINAKPAAHFVVQCPTCEQHEMSVDHIGWDEVGNAICPVCSTNWRIEHPSPPPMVQRMSGDWVLIEQPQDFLVGKVLLQHIRYGFYVVVEECLQGDKAHPEIHFEELYDNRTVPMTEILGVDFLHSARDTTGTDHFVYKGFKSNEQIRQHFHWDWTQFAQNGPLTQEQYIELFPQMETS
ncbi:hypothetical protein D3C71_77670 [compost metagenome]